MLEKLVRDVQRFYPQIYLACHIDHVRQRTTEWKLSSRDSSILSHLDCEHAISPRRLAAHLGVALSTLSATIARLESHGYITSTAPRSDRRKRELRLTAKGADAMASTSVLDAAKVRALLDRLNPRERREAVRGLSLLARAATS